ncbi:glycosyltransferase family 2 protein [Tabrizicola sp.]|uniref:glycosyltransferase family 2 protein n=1 Tax=Tabrizicola sp. TaxID=2005166 RepID=UPI002735AAD9|nr:glycosyltransferase [Tabrizicola sp.]MDP3194729.1 glycosyltransferase [Tabrizicola sp.]
MTDTERTPGRVGAVVIGRNEGARLIACLASFPVWVRPLVYVDSGSTDGSAAAARKAGAEVVALDMSQPFTAARARNEGFARLRELGAPEFVQFVDGDCRMQPGWLEAAVAFLAARPSVAVVCGRRREVHPEASVWNRLCDAEWDTPPGQAKACGGDALMRVTPVAEVEGYDSSLIAGEEPELCIRLRRAGWEVWRIDQEMTLHDAAMTRIGQWWKRTRRGGHAFAEGAAMHGAAPERHWVAETRRAVLWGAVLPLVTGLGLVLTPWAGSLLLAYPLQILRLSPSLGWERATFLVLGKVPEAQGVLEFHLNRLRRRRAGLIEYK